SLSIISLRVVLYTDLSTVFFYASATTEIYPLSLHDALPISDDDDQQQQPELSPSSRLDFSLMLDFEPSLSGRFQFIRHLAHGGTDRKSTRLNSSHVKISYAVFCLKKKNKNSQISL